MESIPLISSENCIRFIFQFSQNQRIFLTLVKKEKQLKLDYKFSMGMIISEKNIYLSYKDYERIFIMQNTSVHLIKKRKRRGSIL